MPHDRHGAARIGRAAPLAVRQPANEAAINPGKREAPNGTRPHERASGDEGRQRLEDRLFSKVLADPVLKASVSARGTNDVDRSSSFSSESPNNPDRFTWFVALYLDALDEAGIPVDALLREAVRSHLGHGSHRTPRRRSHRGASARSRQVRGGNTREE